MAGRGRRWHQRFGYPRHDAGGGREALQRNPGAAQIEWLSDNGSSYTAAATREFATQLNLAPCYTPVGSPESNGMSEAFVKTLKRDYLRARPVPDARTALDQIAGWFEDDNDNHSHSGLKMRSPREFIRAQQPARVSG